MGFFEKVGRGTEKLKKRMTDAAAEGAMFECANCGTELFTEPDACPECGSDAIVERVEEGGGGQARDETDDGTESTEADSGEGTDEEAASAESDGGAETADAAEPDEPEEAAGASED